jgi:hypothetical protein
MGKMTFKWLSDQACLSSHSFSQNWDSMYYYMKKAENYTAPSQQVATAFGIQPSASDYGSGGPIQVSFDK